MTRHRIVAAALTLAAVAATTLLVATRGHAQAPAGRTLVLHVGKTKIVGVDMPPLIHGKHSPETPGDELIATSDVTGGASGRRYLQCAVVRKGRDVAHARYGCAVTYNLQDGSITAAGVVSVAKPTTAAVTGGTGAYAGASGSLTSVPGGADTLTLR
jgi:hypothetical protein